jgi:hypothetical protein
MNTYEEYAILDAQIKALEVKKESMRVEILKDMVDKGEDKIETSVGSFSVARLKKWVYPEYVTEMNESFKAAKAKAESTGEATYTEVESLKFNSIKL